MISHWREPGSPFIGQGPLAPVVTPPPGPRWQHLARMPQAQLPALDIAYVNLLCAEGLPGGEKIDIPYCLRKLDEWAATVRRCTDLAYDQFFLTNPGQYRNSEPFFRMVSLVTCLQRHCGVRFDPAKKGLTPEEPFDLVTVHLTSGA